MVFIFFVVMFFIGICIGTIIKHVYNSKKAHYEWKNSIQCRDYMTYSNANRVKPNYVNVNYAHVKRTKWGE